MYILLEGQSKHFVATEIVSQWNVLQGIIHPDKNPGLFFDFVTKN